MISFSLRDMAADLILAVCMPRNGSQAVETRSTQFAYRILNPGLNPGHHYLVT